MCNTKTFQYPTPLHIRGEVGVGLYCYRKDLIHPYCSYSLRDDQLGFRMVSLRISSNLRLEYIRSLLQLPVSLLDLQPPGQTAAIITATTNKLQIGISEKLALLIQSVSLVVSALIIAFIHSWKMTLVTCSGLFVVAVCYGITTPFVTKSMKQVENANIQASSVATETLSSMRMVAACGAQSKMVVKYNKWVDDSRRRGLRLSRVIGFQQATSTYLFRN